MLLCNIHKHNIIPIKSTLKLTAQNKFLQIPTNYCRDCKKVFIGNQTLNLYEQQYGKVLLHREEAQEKTYNSEFKAFKSQSQLHQTGYNVINGNWTKTERQAHLNALISNNIMTQFEIIRDLEFTINIFQNRSNYSRAIEKWQQDLLFISRL